MQHCYILLSNLQPLSLSGLLYCSLWSFEAQQNIPSGRPSPDAVFKKATLLIDLSDHPFLFFCIVIVTWFFLLHFLYACAYVHRLNPMNPWPDRSELCPLQADWLALQSFLLLFSRMFWFRFCVIFVLLYLFKPLFFLGWIFFIRMTLLFRRFFLYFRKSIFFFFLVE